MRSQRVSELHCSSGTFLGGYCALPAIAFSQMEVGIALQFGRLSISGDGALNQAVRVRLRHIHFGVFSSVL